jgi:hypothetical protein
VYAYDAGGVRQGGAAPAFMGDVRAHHEDEVINEKHRILLDAARAGGFGAGAAQDTAREHQLSTPLGQMFTFFTARSLRLSGIKARTDPLGRVGRKQRGDLNRIHQPIWSEDDAEMPADASTCGPRPLAALVVGLSEGKDAFLHKRRPHKVICIMRLSFWVLGFRGLDGF